MILLYVNKQAPIEVVAIKDTSITTYNYEPLFNDLKVTPYERPAKQQVYSKKNYVQNNYELVTSVTEDKVLDEVIKIIKNRDAYAYNLK